MRKALLAVASLVLVVLSAPALSTAAEASDKGETVVSLTFDGTYKGQEVAAQILSDNGLAGTFYINSGYIGYPAYLGVDELRSIARNRNEIGGASLYGNDLSKQTVAQAKQQVCDDRATLAQLGFQVTSFAYPHATDTAQVKSVAQQCGYNNGRDLAGLYASESQCSSCPKGESLPPTDDFRIRTNEPGVTLDLLKRHVRNAENSGGGWVPLVFTRVGVDPDDQETTITPDDFTTFVTWLKSRPDSTSVETVDQVMDGPLKPAVGTPLARLVPNPSAAVSTPLALSHVPAWTVLGVGIGQAQILMLGCSVAVAIIVTYRLATRGNRYART